MVESNEQAERELEEDVARIVEEGEGIREAIAARIGRAITRIGDGFSGLASVARSTIRGALDGAGGEERREETLRQVLDGMGDGVSRAALAARLACDEAIGRGRSYATEDLADLRREFGDAGTHVAEAIGHAFATAGDGVAEEVEALKRHAASALVSAGPALQAALDAAKSDPSGLAHDAAQASVAGAREAAGSLFGALGGFLQRAGDRLRGD